MNYQHIKDIIHKRSKLHSNDPNITDYWNNLIDLLKKDEKETLNFIKNCNEQELYYISEIFEDLSIIFQSQNFVDKLVEISKQYPNAKMDSDIEDAQRVIED